VSGLLLDSNALVWWLDDDPRLQVSGVRDLIAVEPLVMVSVVSPWELWIKASLGKFRLPDRFDQRLRALPIDIIAPTLDDARLAAQLPAVHRDPFDRMIVAQALNRGAAVVTGDRQLAAYGVQVLRV
jgi:PIN domain nuclease of toxin-antitoxin system